MSVESIVMLRMTILWKPEIVILCAISNLRDAVGQFRRKTFDA